MRGLGGIYESFGVFGFGGLGSKIKGLSFNLKRLSVQARQISEATFCRFLLFKVPGCRPCLLSLEGQTWIPHTRFLTTRGSLLPRVLLVLGDLYNDP